VGITLLIMTAVVVLLLVIYFGAQWGRTQSTDVQRRPRQREEQWERQTKGIFISYRRDENAAHAGWIADTFQEHYGEDKVFRDIDSLEPGLDFLEAVERAIDSSEVLVAVIGRNWVTATDAAGRRRLENPDDYERMEIAAALQRNIRVVPLLVQGASMPSADELPDDLAPLARRNAFELHDTSWRDDVRRLTSVLERMIER
jgi:TIR domain